VEMVRCHMCLKMKRKKKKKGVLTIRTIPDERTPPSQYHFGEADFDLHLANRELTFLGVDLALEGF